MLHAAGISQNICPEETRSHLKLDFQSYPSQLRQKKRGETRGESRTYISLCHVDSEKCQRVPRDAGDWDVFVRGVGDVGDGGSRESPAWHAG